MVVEVCYHIDVEKEYIFLCVKKWLAYSIQQELIPKLEFDFYVTECHKITKTGTKKASVLCCLIDDARLNQLSIEIYTDRLQMFLKETFPTVWMKR
jgi:hypothetical protein